MNETPQTAGADQDVNVVGFYFTRDEWESLSADDRSAMLLASAAPSNSPPASKVGGERR